jgi:hypothetical protein
MLTQAVPVAQSVQRLATGWMVWGLKLGGGKIYRNCPDRSRGPSRLLYRNYYVIFVVKPLRKRQTEGDMSYLLDVTDRGR